MSELSGPAIAAVEAEGYDPNVYVGDELYVSAVTKEARDYAGFQGLEIHEVGNLIDWLVEPPTKLVCVGDPDELLDAIGSATAPYQVKILRGTEERTVTVGGSATAAGEA